MNATDRYLADVIISLERGHQHLERRIELAFGRRNFIIDRLHQRFKVRRLVGHVFLGDAGFGGGVDDGEIELVIVGVELHEKFEHLIDDLLNARVGTIDLIDHDDRF